MSYKMQEQMERYIDNFYECDTETFISEFEWLVRAVISDPTHAREMLIDAIKEVTND
tara:strand:+ start:195 stop:365 length:171 start_codon:yes stop_codon:yes gene_type:complete